MLQTGTWMLVLLICVYACKFGRADDPRPARDGG